MKSIFILMSLFSQIASATYTCTDVPDTLAFESVHPNHDGSSTYTKPKILFNGKMEYVRFQDPARPYGGASGVCYLVGQKMVDAYQAEVSADVLTVTIGFDGRFIEKVYGHPIIGEVICR